MKKSRKEFLEEYGDVVVYFVGYYKYKFTYEASLEDDKVISVEYGDSDIYRDNLTVAEKVSNLMYGEYTTVTIDGELAV